MTAVLLHDILFSLAKLWYFTLASEPAFVRQARDHQALRNMGRLIPPPLHQQELAPVSNFQWLVQLIMLKRAGQARISESLRRILTPDTLNSVGTALRILLLSTALSSWTRASLVLQNRLPVSRLRRARDDEDVSRFAAAYHLVVAYTALKLVQTRYAKAISRLAKIVPINLLAPPTTNVSKPTLKAVIVLGILFTILDEVLHHLFLQTLIAPRRIWAFGKTKKPKDWIVRGRPAKGMVNDDCCICYGAGLDSDSDMDSLLSEDDEEPTLTEEQELSRGGRLRRARSWFRRNMGLSRTAPIVENLDHGDQVIGDGEFWDFDAVATQIHTERPRQRDAKIVDDEKGMFSIGDELENFCKFPTHVAHRNCMRKWIESGLSFPRTTRKGCPVCREPLLMALAPVDSVPRKHSLSDLNPFNLIPIPRLRFRDVVQDAPLMIRRAAINYAALFGVSGALLWRGVVSL
jgi:hypothetical protein